MLAFLRWARGILLSVLNGFAKAALVLVALLLILLVIGLARGDGLPGNMVLALDLRSGLADSQQASPLALAESTPSVMDIVLALDAAERDKRVKGVVMRTGTGGLSVAQAEEIAQALKRFRRSGKFVMAHSQGFLSPGLGDYLAATAGEIWMQPKSPFMAAGTGGAEIFLRGALEKIGAEPQIVKRAEYKSAADMFMEKEMSPADREQLTALMTSVYKSAVAEAAAARKLPVEKVVAALEASPQFTEEARAAGLIDKTGYDDDMQNAALARAGKNAKPVRMAQYAGARGQGVWGSGPRIALLEAAGDIVDGKANIGFTGGGAIGGDDISEAAREIARDKTIKAVLLRIDSPGGSVAASDQILDAMKKLQASGKPLVVSMGSVAASGGYYVSASANRIVAQPATITGSIGVLTGKVTFGKTMDMLGVGADEVAVGRNTLIDSTLTPYSTEQLAAINRQADVIYDDFKQKVSAGRKMPMAKVEEVARGRVWSGADAKAHGLVDELGGFWTAADAARKAAGIDAGARLDFAIYPKPKGFLSLVDMVFGNASAMADLARSMDALVRTPPMQALVRASQAAPSGRVELRAPNLPTAP